ncbi:hypothetical protein [Streptomyces sp. NPDC057939]|uniref:hypothetical protein n=1 Tax=Streptomyces sp. NPDC057939 TaxID=3346284 RepID=UPI0036E02163
MSANGPGKQLLDLLGEHWESVDAALTEEQRRTLRTRLGDLGAAAGTDGRAVRRALQGVRLALRPLPFDHPVRTALDSVRLTASVAAPADSVVGARALLARLAVPQPSPVPPPDTAAIVGAVHRRLLAAPSLATEEVRARCGGAPPPEVIRLPDPVRGDRYPEFQFAGGEGGAYGVVLEVNRLLLADVDPWGAADWWLSGNVQLGGAPASLLGELPGERLVLAAAALVEGY